MRVSYQCSDSVLIGVKNTIALPHQKQSLIEFNLKKNKLNSIISNQNNFQFHIFISPINKLKKTMKNLFLFSFLILSTFSWSQTAENYFDQAIKKSNAGNTQGAIQDYNKAIKLKPAFGEAYLNRSMEKFKLNDFESALADANKALELHDDNTYAYTTRANIYYKLKDYKAALKDCDVAIKYNSGDYITFNLRGLTYIHLEDKKNACADFAKAAQLGSQSAVKNLKMFCK